MSLRSNYPNCDGASWGFLALMPMVEFWTVKLIGFSEPELGSRRRSPVLM